MGIIKIGTFNVKDNKINRSGGLREDGISNADIVAKKIEEFDLLGTQELSIKYVNSIKLKQSKYKFYGNYRYGKLLAYMPFNESNHIITNKKVIKSKTVHLLWIPHNIKDLKTSIKKFSIMPRIATIVIIDDDGIGKFCMINTHLDYEIPSIQLRQLKALQKLINKYSCDYPVILTGDFNMELSDYKFNDFINSIKSNKIKHVDIDGYSWKDKDGTCKMLDHVFVPNAWEVEEAYVDDSEDIATTSDHKPLVVKARIK